MDQKKIGSLLKELRKEKRLTRNSWQNILMYRQEVFLDGKTE